MGMISGLQKIFGFYPTKWLGITQIKQQTIGIKALILGLFNPRKARQTETFAAALQRLKLTEQDIQKRQQEFNTLYKIFSSIALILMAYICYLFYHKAWWPALGSCGILLIILAHVFRYHFWLFQIQQRKLGCSFKEWFDALRGRK